MKQHDTLVILGSHPGTRGEFDWNRVKDVDIWSFNEAVSIGSWIKHSNGVFQMHIPAIWRNPANRNDKNHANWLQSGETPPVFMQEAYPDVPQAIKYPLEEVINTLLPKFHKPASLAWDNRGGFFTSSIDYAMALGIYYGYTRIEIYGAEMGLNSEYVYQRPGFTFWFGIALGRGIEVDYHGSVFDCPLYGYEGDIYLPRKIFDNRILELRHLAQESTIAYQVAKKETDETLDLLVTKSIDVEKCYPVFENQVKAATKYAIHDGALQENERYISKVEAMEGVAGEFRISRTEFEQASHACAQKRNKAMQDATYEAVNVENAFKAMVAADGYKKRLQAAERFKAALEKQINCIAEMAGYDAAGAENVRYMRVLDERYRAAGGAKSVEVLEGISNNGRK